MSVLAFELQLPLAHFELDVRVESGARALGLYGPSGAGKTSLIEALAGWRNVRAGRIEVAGRTWLDTARGVRLSPAERRAGYVPQDLLLFPHLDVEGNLRFGAHSTEDRELERALEVLEIGALRRRDVATLSGGERQRVALARALCARPALLLLDEPLGALDRALRRRILPYLVRIRAEFDVPLVIVSHDPTEIQVACEQALVLERGRIVAQGSPAEVLAEAAARGGPEEEFENVLSGTVRSLSGTTARIDLGGEWLEVPRGTLATGERALVAVRADDVLVATERPRGLSARNVLAARIERVERGAAARLRARSGAQAVWVELTEGALDELELREGREVFLVIKTRACRVLASGSTG